MYRIVKETNKLSGKIVYIIEKRKNGCGWNLGQEN